MTHSEFRAVIEAASESCMSLSRRWREAFAASGFNDHAAECLSDGAAASGRTIRALTHEQCGVKVEE